MAMNLSVQVVRRVVVATLAAAVFVGAGVAAQQAQEPSAEVKQLLSGKACADCFLAGAALSAAKLDGADLQRANLFEANLYFTDLTKANLTGANLQRANLRKARLEGANFTGADLTGADLTWATDADLSGAVTTATTTCPGGTPGPCL